MPKHPEQGKRAEQQLPSYYRAARFREDSVSKKVYDQAQELIQTTVNELSAYRFLRPSQVAKEPPWYVVVVGDTPEEPLRERIEEILQPGEQISLPAEALTPLYQRRLQEIQKGPYVEAHHPITMRRKQETSKRKMQKGSRRRNRER